MLFDDFPSQQSERWLKYTWNPSRSQLPLKYTRVSGTETAVVRRPFLHPSDPQRWLSLDSQASCIHDVHPLTTKVLSAQELRVPAPSVGLRVEEAKPEAVAPLELRVTAADAEKCVATDLGAVSAAVSVTVSKG